MKFSAVILAGGKSRRMGRDKAWVELDGRPLITVAIEKIQRLGVEEIFISGRTDVDYSALNCPVLQDHQPECGPLEGIGRGLEACQAPLLLVLAVDMAAMRVEMLQQLMAQCDPMTGVVPELPAGLEPLAAIYPKRSHTLVQAAITDSRFSARDFATVCQREKLVRFWPIPTSAAEKFSNWNHPGDLPN
jgi:molybdenum cofactor guanylyltransferase